MVSNYPQAVFLPRAVPHVFGHRTRARRPSSKQPTIPVPSPSLTPISTSSNPTFLPVAPSFELLSPLTTDHDPPSSLTPSAVMSTVSDSFRGQPSRFIVPDLTPITSESDSDLPTALQRIFLDYVDIGQRDIVSAIAILASGDNSDHHNLSQLLENLSEIKRITKTAILRDYLKVKGDGAQQRFE